MAAGRANKRKRYHHGDLRNALLDATSELVGLHGAQGFSLREAARRVGVDPAACYRHFRNREALLHAFATAGFSSLAQQMAEAVHAVDDPAARLVTLGRTYVAFARAHPTEFRVMFGESGTDARDPRLRPDDVERTGYEQLEDEVARWARARRLSLDVPLIALELWAVVHGLARLVVDGAVTLDVPAIEAMVEDLALAVLERAGRVGDCSRHDLHGTRK